MSYRLPLATTILIWVQMVLGGIVVGKDAGFICPTWPSCDGSWVPPTITGTLLLELVHRAAALIVAVLVFGIAVWVWRKHSDNRVLLILSTLSAVSLVVQIVVGGMIVLFVLPGAVTTIDVMNSMVMLGLYVALTVEAYRCTAARSADRPWPNPDLQQLAGTGVGVLATGGVAVLVGALFRHTGASEALFGMNNYLASHGQHSPPSLPVSAGFLVVHIMTGLVVAMAALWLLFRAMQVRQYVKSSVLLLVLIGLQVVLGALSLTSKLDFVIATLHWTNAGAIIAIMSWIAATAVLAGRLSNRTDHVEKRPVVPKPGTVG